MAVEKQKLTFRFHNPNPVEASAEYILRVLIEVNKPKLEKALQEASNKATSSIIAQESPL